jgi:hypothetical protein
MLKSYLALDRVAFSVDNSVGSDDAERLGFNRDNLKFDSSHAYETGKSFYQQKLKRSMTLPRHSSYLEIRSLVN